MYDLGCVTTLSNLGECFLDNNVLFLSLGLVSIYLDLMAGFNLMFNLTAIPVSPGPDSPFIYTLKCEKLFLTTSFHS